jgi:hypothetical protein
MVKRAWGPQARGRAVSELLSSFFFAPRLFGRGHICMSEGSKNKVWVVQSTSVWILTSIVAKVVTCEKACPQVFTYSLGGKSMLATGSLEDAVSVAGRPSFCCPVHC